MEAVGTMAYTVSSGSVDFMLYNSFDPEGRLQWVCWKRGVDPQEFRNGLFDARILLEWNGVEYTYDFHRGGYQEAEGHPEIGWIPSDTCLSHLGGTIAKFFCNSSPHKDNEFLESSQLASPTLRDLVWDSESTLRVETRTRPKAYADGISRRFFMKTKFIRDVRPRIESGVEPVACAA